MLYFQEKEHAKLEHEVRDLRLELQQLNFDEQSELDLGQEQDARQREHASLWKRHDALASSLAAHDFKYTDPVRGFDRRRVKGTVASNISVRDQRNAPALEAVAGGRLHQVIVDNEETGVLLLTKGGLQRRVTLIPLTKIRCDCDNEGLGRWRVTRELIVPSIGCALFLRSLSIIG